MKPAIAKVAPVNMGYSAGYLATLFALCLAILVSWLPPWRAVDRFFVDHFAVWTAPGRSSLPITIIGIDEESFAALQLPWPWPRDLYARLLERLHEAGVALVAFDIVFAEPSTDLAQDEAFALAIERFGPVVLAADLAYVQSAAAHQWQRIDPLPLFLKAGAQPGLASVELDNDGVLRRMPLYADAFWRVIVDRFGARYPEFHPPIVPQDDMRLNYRGGPGSYLTIPFHKMLDPDRHLSMNWRDILKDNIVLIGRNTRAGVDIQMAQADAFATPFMVQTGEFTPGVELHATLVDNMMSGDFRRELPGGWGMMMAVVTVAISHLGMRRWRPVSATLTLLAVAVTLFAVAFLAFWQWLTWLPVATALLALVLVYLGQGYDAYVREQRQRRQIKAAFAMYVAPDVVEEVIADPARLRLGGERREITVMFTDLVGFTSIAEAMTPEEVATLLNRHLTEMTAIIHRYRGTVDKYIGDAVMAFWGAPLADPEQSHRALRAANEMQEAMHALRDEVLAEGGPELKMRVGLHRGECIVGNMGSEQRFDYSAIGDTVNMASRLEGANKTYGTGILLSQAMADALGPQVAIREIDFVRVKGKRQGVSIYTPCDSPVLIAATKDLLAAYRAGELGQASLACDRLDTLASADLIAACYRLRIEALRASGIPADWDATADLEK